MDEETESRPTDRVAVEAARRLAPEFGMPLLPVDVEAAVRSHRAEDRREYFFDPVAVAGLVVAVAEFAWDVYQGTRKEGRKPDRETLTRTVLTRRREIGGLTAAEERVVEIVVAEILEVTRDAE